MVMDMETVGVQIPAWMQKLTAILEGKKDSSQNPSERPRKE